MKKAIGIVGGVGPYAGLDLNKKIFDNMKTKGADQDYLDVFLVSRSSDIPDRTSFLKHEGLENPAEGLFRSVLALEKLGAKVIAIPCNTAHSPEIYNKLCEWMHIAGCESELLNIVAETHHFMEHTFSSLKTIGLLGTLGTFETHLYDDYFHQKGIFRIITPEDEGKKACHDAIYNKSFGIKAFSNPVRDEAKDIVYREIQKLQQKGAEAVILGCTELPLVFDTQTSCAGVLLIDPTMILARALIEHADRNALKPCLLKDAV
jgi:aspartate racemase